jgi:hypothetical protein
MTLIVGAAIVAGLLVGLFRGGHLSAIGEARLRLLWIAPLALVAQVVLVRAVGARIPWWVLPVQGAAYGLLLVFVLANRSVLGVSVIGVGLLLNAIVILANGGLMPQAPETARLRHAGETIAIGEHIPGTKDVLLERDATRLWWLSDHLVLPALDDRPSINSPGDLVLAAGLAVTVFGLTRRPRPLPTAPPARGPAAPSAAGPRGD